MEDDTMGRGMRAGKKAKTPGMGGGNMQKQMMQMQAVQRKMEQVQAEIDEMETTATSGGGAVTVTVCGKKEITAIEIKPEVVDADDVDNYTIELPDISYSYTINTGVVFTTITFEIVNENGTSIASTTKTDVKKELDLIYGGPTIDVADFKKGSYGIKVYGTIGDIMPEETTLKIKRMIVGSYKITRKK